MTTGYAIGYDAIAASIPSLPAGAAVYAGYATGTDGVPWSEEDFAAHATALGPCLRICQDPQASDPTADIADFETGAVQLSRISGWAKDALASFEAGHRPGQRSPATYQSASNVSAVASKLVSSGITRGIGLVVADWSVTEAQAVKDVLDAAGPFPVVGYQIRDAGPYDVDVFSRAWLAAQSGKHPVPAAVPGIREWVTGGLESLEELADGERVAVSTILRMTAEHAPGSVYQGNVANWLDAVFAGKVSPAEKMPAGLKLYLPG